MRRLTPILLTLAVLLGSPGEGFALPKCPGSYNANTWTDCVGTYTFTKSGNKYVGEYKDGKRHGQGTFTHASGIKYVGEWKDDKANGQGTESFGPKSKWAGDKYVGEFKDDKRHGQGTYTFADGRVKEGIFENGEFKYAKKLTPSSKPKPAKQVAKASPPTKARIVIRARSNNWIQVRDDIGNKVLVSRLLRTGDHYEVPDQPGLRLLTGNAGALEVLVDGELVPAIGDWGAVRRNVRLDADKLRAGIKGTKAVPEKSKPAKQVAKASPPTKPAIASAQVQDTTPPSIEIASAIKVKEDSPTIRGRVTDANKVVQVTVNDVAATFSGNTFSFRRYVPISGTQVTIEAVDEWGNRSTKVVKLTREAFKTAAIRFDALNPTNFSAKRNSDAVALIIGIADYKRTAQAKYADRDAEFFADYARRKLGVP